MSCEAFGPINVNGQEYWMTLDTSSTQIEICHSDGDAIHDISLRRQILLVGCITTNKIGEIFLRKMQLELAGYTPKMIRSR